MNSFDFAGQTAIVTGGGQGIGLTVTERILASGGQVAVWDRDAALITELAGRLDSARAMTQAVDIGDLAAVQVATAQVIARWGGSTCW